MRRQTSPNDRRAAVGVSVPTFNGISYVGQAIQSVLGQMFEDFELIVIDAWSGLPSDRVPTTGAFASIVLR